jgi:DNA-binding NarL/FixJ family response regulator
VSDLNSDTKVISVVLVDDHMLVRQGIRTVLEKSSEIAVVGEAESYEAAVKVLSEKQPSVVVLDLQIPNVSGVELCWEITRICPETAILILTAFLNPQLLRSCLAAGARGYLLKETENLDIVAAVKTVAKGGTVFDKRTSTLERDIFGDTQQIFDSLSPKELQVLSLLCHGLTNNEIADDLKITLNTVKTHIKTIMRKLDCRNRVEIVLRTQELKLI